MNFICMRQSLIEILSIADSIISAKNNFTSQSNILLQVKDSKLKVSAFETKINFLAEIGVDVIQEGEIAVFCKKFYSIIKSFDCEEVSIKTNEHGNIILSPKENTNIQYDLKTLDSDKLPRIEEPIDIEFISLPQQIFVNMIKKTIISISLTENRRFISGIYFETIDNSIKMVSTDGKRLSFTECDFDIKKSFENGIIVPPKILQEIIRLSKNNGDLLLGISDKNIHIKIDNFYFVSNLLDGDFPPYKKVIPMDQLYSFKVNTSLLNKSLNRISLIGDKESHRIIFELNNNLLKIYTEDISHGSGKEVIDVEYNGDQFEVALNYSFIIDALSVISTEKTIFEFKDANNTITMKEDDNDKFIYIMMPMSKVTS